MNDLVVVGAGLAGLLAANFAARRGATVALVAEGRGGLSLSHGCLELGPFAHPERLPGEHPYRLTGPDKLRSGVQEFLEIISGAGLAYQGTVDSRFDLPTAAGAVLSVQLAPRSLAQGHLNGSNSPTITGIEGFRDFDPTMVVQGLQRRGHQAHAIDLPYPAASSGRDSYSTDIGRGFDRPRATSEAARMWSPLLKGVRRLGLPAVVGLLHNDETLARLEAELSLPVFEIPTLPPSLPGLRLERALWGVALRLGCRLIEGPAAVGRIDGTKAGLRALGVSAVTPAGPRAVEAGAVLLATGGVLHGGLRTTRGGRVHDSVFDLPVSAPPEREAWVDSALIGPHPYDRFGLAVNHRMQPCGNDGHPYFSNVFACGGIVGGVDRRREGSRQGIDIVTAYAAVEAALS